MVGSDLAELLVQRSQSDGSWQPSAATALIDFSDGSTSEAPPLRGDDLLTGSCSNFQPSEGALQRYTQLLLAGRKKVPDSQLYIISSFAARVCVLLAIQLNFSSDIIFLFHEWSQVIFNLLFCGSSRCIVCLQEALEEAMSSGLWGHALFLASRMDSRSYNNVLNR